MFKIDETTEFGRRTKRRLEEEVVIWLTTISASGKPEPRPVWFYWDGETFHVYSQPDTYKLQHIQHTSHVALNFDSDGEGSNIVVFGGEASIVDDAPPADQDRPYIVKYEKMMRDMGMSPQDFARDYSVAIHVRPTDLRGH